MNSAPETILTVRPLSGLSGDMMLAGLAALARANDDDLAALIRNLRLPVPARVRLTQRRVEGIAGQGVLVELPHEHAHRTFADIRDIIAHSALAPDAADYALRAFALLARAEAEVHGMSVDSVHFHEVGALDSIVDICLCCALFARLKPGRFVCGPLPLADGSVMCAHGILPAPAPAVLALLENVAVCGFSGTGETVTPTAITLLKTLGAEFGPWPDMLVERRALVYGSKVFPHAPNGAIWACGAAL